MARIRNRYVGLALLAGPTLAGFMSLSALCGAENARVPAKYVTRGSIRPDLALALRAYGDRLQKPGKERIVIAGTVSVRGSAEAPFQVTQELPNLCRFDVQSGPLAGSAGFDSQQYWRKNGMPQKQDADLLRTLIYDSPARFFLMQADRMPVRKLGSRFRLDGLIGKPYSGTTYDIYLAVDTLADFAGSKRQPKHFYLNSNTLLVERIDYLDALGGNGHVQCLVSGWLTVANNRVPQIIRRIENGTEVLRLTVTVAAFGPSVPDGAFRP